MRVLVDKKYMRIRNKPWECEYCFSRRATWLRLPFGIFLCNQCKKDAYVNEVLTSKEDSELLNWSKTNMGTAQTHDVKDPKKGETTEEAIEAISKEWENVLRRLAE